MRLRTIYMKSLCILIGWCLSIAVRAQHTISIEVSKDTIAVGETVDVTYKIENGDGQFTMPDFTNLPLIAGPNSSSGFLYANGKMTSNQSYQVTLLGVEPGVMTIPGTVFRMAKDTIDIQPVVIFVAGEDLHLSVPKQNAPATKSSAQREKRKF